MRKSIVLAGLLAAVPAAARAAEDPAPRTRWAGHQIVVGTRDVPLLGGVDTRTDSYLLAEVEKGEDGSYTLVQRTCRVAIAESARVKVAFLPGAEPKLPATTFRFVPRGDRLHAEFESGWDASDVDGDGAPGATMVVSAPLCGGRLHVATWSATRLRGREAGGAIAGEAQAISKQKTIGSEGACLAMMASDADDRVRGTFAYVPVPPGSTCETLLAGDWPAKAAEPKSRRERRPAAVERIR